MFVELPSKNFAFLYLESRCSLIDWCEYQISWDVTHDNWIESTWSTSYTSYHQTLAFKPASHSPLQTVTRHSLTMWQGSRSYCLYQLLGSPGVWWCGECVTEHSAVSTDQCLTSVVLECWGDQEQWRLRLRTVETGNLWLPPLHHCITYLNINNYPVNTSSPTHHIQNYVQCTSSSEIF